MSATFKQHGLVGDFWPNVRLMQLFGHFLFEYHEDNSGPKVVMRKAYAFITCALILAHYVMVCLNAYLESAAGGDMAADSITCLFFMHSIVKYLYFAFRSKLIYRALASWDSVNSHPLFAESHARHRASAVSQSRKLLLGIVCVTVLSIIAWTTSTFFGESTKTIKDPANVNETLTIDIPRLPIHAFYPWNAMMGMPYVFTFLYQLYWLTMTLFHANLFDLLFCNLLIFACEQLQHVKDVMKPLMELSSTTESFNPSNIDLFRANNGNDDSLSKDEQQINIRGIYSNIRDFGMNGNSNGAISTVNGGPNGFSKKQEMLVRSAIKYWVERHKHIVRYVDTIGDAYGISLLLHMLISTVALTLLAYQATKIDGVNLFSLSVIGYLLYSLGQVFAFCVYGNQLIEESSSVMESAYNCQWYDGSEEAKTFVQIVCQQCQKSLSISGAKFFTVSLDLFASVLGAVVTYFMVLVQLK